MSLTKVSYSMINGAPAVNIVDFGGQAGSSDNTAAMNAAADALHAIGGGVILIPYVGEWRMNWVCLYDNITVQGVGGGG
jgi:polygalacturonase